MAGQALSGRRNPRRDAPSGDLNRSIQVFFRNKAVGADAHFGPADCTVFTGIFGKFVTAQRADVGIGPYTQNYRSSPHPLRRSSQAVNGPSR